MDIYVHENPSFSQEYFQNAHIPGISLV